MEAMIMTTKMTSLWTQKKKKLLGVVSFYNINQFSKRICRLVDHHNSYASSEKEKAKNERYVH